MSKTLKGTRTENNLITAFAGESQARNRYRFFADTAKKEGLEQIADLFLDTARNEDEHAEHEFKFLYDFDDTKSNLETAIQSEASESSTFYPEAAKVAAEEGFIEIADFFRRMQKVEEKHKQNFLQALDSLVGRQVFEGRTVSHSAVTLVAWMLPQQANAAGFVHGGELMKLMDNAAFLVASRHSRSNVVTVGVEGLEFRKPVRIGDMVTVNAKMVYTGKSSMEIRLEVDAENIIGGAIDRVLIAHYTMVALDSEGKSANVPQLILSTEEEEKLFKEALQRYMARKKSP